MPINVAMLKKAAESVAGQFRCSADCTAGGVGAAIMCDSGEVFTGLCIDTACSLGFCAEHAAVAEMLKSRKTQVSAVVAVNDRGTVLPPCGRCRELLYQINPANLEADVILSDDRILKLRELLPYRS
jgi:cytidine deaminase